VPPAVACSEADPDGGQAHARRAAALGLLGRHPEERAALEGAAALAPGSAELRRRLKALGPGPAPAPVLAAAGAPVSAMEAEPELEELTSAADAVPEMGPVTGLAEDEGESELGEADIAMMLKLRLSAAQKQQHGQVPAVGGPV
jgi:hypothetical protein